MTIIIQHNIIGELKKIILVNESTEKLKSNYNR